MRLNYYTLVLCNSLIRYQIVLFSTLIIDYNNIICINVKVVVENDCQLFKLTPTMRL